MLRERIFEKARSLGFDAMGVARADVPLGVEHDRYRGFVERGLHGTMAYLAEGSEVRRQLHHDTILVGAKSVVCLARRYQRGEEDEGSDPPLAKLVARYARGHDYHNHLRKKVRALARFMASLGDDVRTRVLCDEEPVLERAWAQRAGLGFVGKNGLVIVPGQGSFVLLGEVVTTLALPEDEPMTERCGSCTRCLDACPTSAFEAAFVLDPRRCVAYLTIEDPFAPERGGVGERLFGCDDCQAVCPYNRAPVDRAANVRPFRPLPAFEGRGLADLVRFDEHAFRAFATGSPLRRATRAGLAANAIDVARARLERDGLDPEGAEAKDARDAIAAGAEHDDARVRDRARAAAGSVRRA